MDIYDFYGDYFNFKVILNFTVVEHNQSSSGRQSHYISLRLFWQVGIGCKIILAKREMIVIGGRDRKLATQVPGKKLATTKGLQRKKNTIEDG